MKVRDKKIARTVISMSDVVRQYLREQDHRVRTTLGAMNYQMWGNRFASNTLRFASVISLAHDYQCQVIGLPQMQEAVQLCEVMINHTVNFHYQAITEDGIKRQQDLKSRILEIFIQSSNDVINDHQIKRALHNKYRAKEVEDAVMVLQFEGQLRKVQLPKISVFSKEAKYKYYQYMGNQHIWQGIPSQGLSGIFEFTN